MRLSIEISDDLVEKVRVQLRLKDELSAKDAIRSRALAWLDRLIPFNPIGDRVVLLDPDQRRDLEMYLQSTVDGPDDLIRKVKNLASVKIGPLEFPLSVGEVFRLKEQAGFHGWDPQKYVEMTCGEIRDRFFDRF